MGGLAEAEAANGDNSSAADQFRTSTPLLATPEYPPCGSSFLRHLHTDPRSKHVHLPTGSSAKPKELRTSFHRIASHDQSDTIAAPPIAKTEPIPSPPSTLPPRPSNVDKVSVPPSSTSISTSQPKPIRAKRRPQTAPSRATVELRHLSSPPAPMDDDADRPMASVQLSTDPPMVPSLAAVIPEQVTGEGLTHVRNGPERQLAWEEFGRAYGSGSWDPVRIPSAPISDPDSNKRRAFIPPSSSQQGHPPSSVFSPTYRLAPTRQSRSIDTMTTDSVGSSEPSTIKTPSSSNSLGRQRSFDLGIEQTMPKLSTLQMPDHNISAATVRLAASNIPPSMFAPLGMPSPERELMDPLSAMFNSTPNIIKASSDPGLSTMHNPAAFTRSASSHSTGTDHCLPTIAASPLGTPGDLSGLPPTLSRTRGSVPARIPAASAPLCKSEPITEPTGDYFGNAVVADGEARASATPPVPTLPIDYPCLRHHTQAETFYKQYGFLAAPPPTYEAKRLKALYSFNILHTANDVNFDRIVHMIKLVFKVKIGFITMVDSDHAWFKARAGFGATQTSRSTSFCSHTILNEDDEPMVILDTHRDWRFANNPHVTGPPHVRFYAGAPLRTSNGFNVGSLCLVDDTPRPEFPPRSRHILKEFAAIVMREMELWRDRLQLRTRDKIQTSMEKFTRECLEIDEEISAADFESSSRMNQVYTRAAKLITNTLDLDGCTILDISQFERVEISTPEGERRTIYHANPYAEGEAHMVEPTAVFGPVSAFPVLATAQAGPGETRALTSSEHEKMSAFLADHRDGRIFEGVAPSWIKYVFPSTLKYGMVVPVIGIDKQPFALICAYTHDKGKQFLEGYELQFLRGIGVIILSAVLRRRMLLADRSKSVLISSVSHELRTPLHGILAASELLGDSDLDPNQDALLSTVRTCGLQLIETVNHVLDFTKLSGGSKHTPTKPQIKLSKTNLTDLILQTVETCWLGARGKSMQQSESQVGSFYAPIVQGLLPHEERVHVQHALAHVETVLDLGPRQGGWNVICETGGLRRSLMNIYSNALKFTTDGYIQVVLRELPTSPGPGRITVQLAVIDTGKGIGKAFLKDQIFQPFSQENPLQPGTGLGLAIVNSIMRSEAIKGNVEVWSIEGEGTEIRLTFDVEVVEDPTQDPIDRTIGNGLTVGFINYDPKHRGLQLSKEVMTQYAEFLGYSVAADYRTADILIMNELSGIAQENLDILKRRPILLMVTFKIWSRDKLSELGLIKDRYMRVMCKPMVRYSLLYELQRVATYVRSGSKGDGSDLGELPSMFSEMALDSPDVLPVTRSLHAPSSSSGGMSSFEPQVKPQAPLNVPSMLQRRRSEEDTAESRPSRPLLGSRGLTYHSGTGSRESTLPSSEVTPPSSTVSLADGGALLKAVAIPDDFTPSKPRTPRVMVVEDNVINRRVLTAFLKKRGCEYAEVVDGLEGVKLFDTTPPNSWDIILMDITMPVMNGYEATRCIRSIELSRRHAVSTPDGSGAGATPLPSPTAVLGSSPSASNSALPDVRQPNHSKIFALTGLATADDKRQAFGSGVDG